MADERCVLASNSDGAPRLKLLAVTNDEERTEMLLRGCLAYFVRHQLVTGSCCSKFTRDTNNNMSTGCRQSINDDFSSEEKCSLRPWAGTYHKDRVELWRLLLGLRRSAGVAETDDTARKRTSSREDAAAAAARQGAGIGGDAGETGQDENLEKFRHYDDRREYIRQYRRHR